MKTPLIVERAYNPNPERQVKALLRLLNSLEEHVPNASGSAKEPGSDAQARKSP